MYHDAPCEASVMVHRKRPGNRVRASEHIRKQYRLDDVVTYLVDQPQPFLKVALQFPDDLLDDAVLIVHELERMLQTDPRAADMEKRLAAAAEKRSAHNTDTSGPGASPATGARASAPRPVTNTTILDNPNAPTRRVRFTILADNTFGSCCPDEITAQHYANDCIVHFGEACLSRTTRIPVFYVLPSFRLDAMTALFPSDDNADARLETEAAVLARVVRAQQTALCYHLQQWRRSQERQLEARDTPTPAVTCELVVVGAPEVQSLLTRAQARYATASRANASLHEDEGPRACVPVEWCTYRTAQSCALSSSPCGHSAITSRCDGESCHCAAASAADGGAAHSDAALASQPPQPSTSSTEWPTTWTINGLTFPRFIGESERAQRRAAQDAEQASDDCHSAVQFFLFVGPSNAPHLVHLTAVEQYNRFHYTEAEQEFIERVTDAEGASEGGTYVISTLDETFGTGGLQEGPGLAWVTAMSASPRDASDPTLPDFIAEHVVHFAMSCDDALPPTSPADADSPSASSFNASLDRKKLYTMACGAAQLLYGRRQRQRDFNIETLRASSSVGILVASLAIDGYYETTMLLHKLLRAAGKRSYILYVGHLNEFKLANFVDTVDCFVAVACPNSRESYFPLKTDNFLKPVVAPSEVLLAIAAKDASSPLYGLPAVYSTAFDYALGPLAKTLQDATEAVSGAAQGSEDGQGQVQTDWGAVGALVRAGGTSQALIAHDATVQGSLARLHERSYVGLDPQIGQTGVQAALLEGLHGIARGYADERSRQ